MTRFSFLVAFLSVCIAQNHSITKFGQYIIGGQDAVPYQFPFFAHIKVSQGGNTGSCGGSLVGPTSVLTAAHCCYCGDTSTTFTISINLYNANGATNSPVPDQCTDTFVDITERSCHPDYVSNSANPRAENDVCLLTLPRASIYKPATLYDSTKMTFNPRLDSEKYPLHIIGFGIKDGQPIGANTLQKAVLPVANSDTCADKYTLRQSDFNLDTDLVMCGNNSFNKDTCQGDSGGPYFTKANGKFIVVGVTSLGGPCADSSLDSLYSRVDTPSFRNWLYGTLYPTTREPTQKPSRKPTGMPSTRLPTDKPTRRPSLNPTNRPTKRPTSQPTPPTPKSSPSSRPTKFPTDRPTKRPSNFPTTRPTKKPTSQKPSKFPTTRKPTMAPTVRVQQSCINNAPP